MYFIHKLTSDNIIANLKTPVLGLYKGANDSYAVVSMNGSMRLLRDTVDYIVCLGGSCFVCEHVGMKSRE